MGVFTIEISHLDLPPTPLIECDRFWPSSLPPIDRIIFGQHFKIKASSVKKNVKLPSNIYTSL